MKIRLLAVGSMRDGALSGATAEYAAKIRRYWPFEIIEIADVKMGKGVADPSRQKELEGERIEGMCGAGDFVVLFDERGAEFTSREFSEFIQKKAVELPRNLIFIIGGPYGFSKSVYNRADKLMSLSRMTFTHEMARLFATEQIYRAATISRGEPYHHD